MVFNTLPRERKAIIKLKAEGIIKKRNLEDLDFENQYYKVKIRDQSIIEKGSRQELLNTKTYLGGKIKGQIRNREVNTRDRGRVTKIEGLLETII